MLPLIRTYSFASFEEAMRFVNGVAALAEERNHHPTIVVEWKAVRLEFWTHSSKSVTEKDIALAAEIDARKRDFLRHSASLGA